MQMSDVLNVNIRIRYSSKSISFKIFRIFGIGARNYCRMMRHNASVTRYQKKT